MQVLETEELTHNCNVSKTDETHRVAGISNVQEPPSSFSYLYSNQER